MAGTPLTITLYGEGDEVIATYSRMFVPWKLLKAAVRTWKVIKPGEMTEDDLDMLAGLVVEAFGNQFSLQDLNEHGDMGDMLAVLQNIISRARNVLGNPIPPPGN